jgi:hypothetical protein
MSVDCEMGPRQFIRRLIDNRKGNVALTFALTLIPISATGRAEHRFLHFARQLAVRGHCSGQPPAATP